MSEKMVFYVCEFQNGEMSVVPEKWVFRTNGALKCRWTSQLKKIKQASIPNPNWKVYDIKKILGKRDSYESADSYISDLKSDSQTGLCEEDIPSDDPVTMITLPGKRKKTKKQRGNSSTSCDTPGSTSSDNSVQEYRTKGQKWKKKTHKGGKTSSPRVQSSPRPPVYTSSDDMRPESEEAPSTSVSTLSASETVTHSSQKVAQPVSVTQSSERIAQPETMMQLSKSIAQPGTVMQLSQSIAQPGTVMQLSQSIAQPGTVTQLSQSIAQPGTVTQSSQRIAQPSTSKQYLFEQTSQKTAQHAASPDPTDNCARCATLPTMADIQKLIDIGVETMKAVNQVKEELRVLQQDMDRVKLALVVLPEVDSRDEIVRLDQHESVETFEDFCGRLEEKPFRKLVTKYLTANYGQKNIGELVRKVLRATMTDDLQLQYNRSGGNKKEKFPATFEKCIYAATSPFHKDETLNVKRSGGQITTTVKQEVGKQIEVYLSNARTRILRQKGNDRVRSLSLS